MKGLCTQKSVIHFFRIPTSLVNCLFGPLGLAPVKWEPAVEGEEGEGSSRLQVHLRHGHLRKEYREQNWDSDTLQTLCVQALLESVVGRRARSLSQGLSYSCGGSMAVSPSRNAPNQL